MLRVVLFVIFGVFVSVFLLVGVMTWDKKRRIGKIVEAVRRVEQQK